MLLLGSVPIQEPSPGGFGGAGCYLQSSPNRVVAVGIVAPMPKKHVGKGTILTLRRTAVVAGGMGRNIGNRDEEGECHHSHDSETDGDVPASHASEGSLKGCKVLLLRTASVPFAGDSWVCPQRVAARLDSNRRRECQRAPIAWRSRRLPMRRRMISYPQSSGNW